jgi:hypothetical protein
VDFQVDRSEVCGFHRQILHFAAISVPFANKYSNMRLVLALCWLRIGLQEIENCMESAACEMQGQQYLPAANALHNGEQHNCLSTAQVPMHLHASVQKTQKPACPQAVL